MKASVARSYPAVYSFASRLPDDPPEPVALMPDADPVKRLAGLRENRRGKGLPAEPTDEQILKIWSDAA
jgi:hypothetical protein